MIINNNINSAFPLRIPQQKAGRNTEHTHDIVILTGLRSWSLMSVVAVCSLSCGVRTPAPVGGDSIRQGPLYAVTAQILGDTPTSYVKLVSSIEDMGTATRDDAIEIAGRAIGFAPEKSGLLFTASSEGATITRWQLDGARLNMSGAISFAAYGVTAINAYPGQFQFISETRAYFIDDVTLQLLVWNPQTLTITKAIPLKDIAKPGWSVTIGLNSTLRDADFVFTASYYKEEQEVYDSETRVVFVDTASDEIVSVVSDSRCAYLIRSFQTSSGDIYFGSDVYAAAIKHTLGPSFAASSCAVRIAKGQRSFDAQNTIDFEARAGAPAGTLIPGPDGFAYLRQLQPALVPQGQLSPRELAAGPYWRWARISLSNTEPAELVTELPQAPSSILNYLVDGRVFTSASTPDYRETTLVELSAAGGPRPGLTFQGVPFSILRLR